MWTVTSSDGAGFDGVCDDDCTLRDALFAAQDGEMITFAPQLGTIALGLQSIVVNKDLTNDGAGRIILQSQGSTAVVAFGAAVELVGLTITGATLGRVWKQSLGTLTLRSATVSGNTSTIEGGGVRSNGDLVVINSSILDNSSDADGGGIWTNGQLTMRNSTIAGNSAVGDGAGIDLNEGSAGPTRV